MGLGDTKPLDERAVRREEGTVTSIERSPERKKETTIADTSVTLQTLARQIDELIANPETLKDSPHPIIYSRLFDPTVRGADAAPPTRESLQDEAQVMMFAGSDTVAHTLTTGLFHVLDNPAVHEKLFAELAQAWPDLAVAPGYEELEKLPYLVLLPSPRCCGNNPVY